MTSQYPVKKGKFDMLEQSMCPALRKPVAEGWALLNHACNGADAGTSFERTKPGPFLKVNI